MTVSLAGRQESIRCLLVGLSGLVCMCESVCVCVCVCVCACVLVIGASSSLVVSAIKWDRLVSSITLALCHTGINRTGVD